MSTITTDAYSDLDLHDPAEYYGGFKEGLIARFGEATRRLSHPVTGEHRGSTFDFDIVDDLRFRQQLASATQRFWSEPLAVRMTSRANRATLGIPYTVFVGPIIDAQPTQPLAVRVTLGDLLSSLLLSDESQAPARLIGDGFLDRLTVSGTLDRTLPEPIIYGEHRRTPDGPASPHGFMVQPIYLGIENLDGTDYHVWMVAGHACADIPDVNVIDADGVLSSVIPDEGTDWLIPHHAGWTLQFGAPYRDIRSATFGVDRRYTLIYGLFGATNPDDVVNGTLSLAVSVDGIEAAGDGSGACIVKRLLQYKHFVTNYVRPDSYQAGLWLDPFEWDLLGDDTPIAVIDEASFDAADLIGDERLLAGAGSPAEVDGYIGAALINERKSHRAYIADWNRSCGVQSGWTNRGQFKVVMVHPTQAVKDAAPLFTAAYEMLRGSFQPALGWSEHANVWPFRADFNTVLGRWETVDAFVAGESVTNYNRMIQGPTLDLPFAPGITAAYHIARMLGLQMQHPPSTLLFDTNLESGLADLDFGDYVRYQHHGAVATAPSEIRLGLIIGHTVRVGARRLAVEVLDLEDLIGFDAFQAPTGVSPLNDTCDNALEITHEPFTPFAANYNTDNHALDTSLDVSPGILPNGGRAYHAFWVKFTPPADGTLFLTTVHSEYDTEIAVFTGGCGGLTLIQHNDNDGVLMTSVLEFAVSSGVELHILVYGHGPDDSGPLTLGLYFTEPE